MHNRCGPLASWTLALTVASCPLACSEDPASPPDGGSTSMAGAGGSIGGTGGRGGSGGAGGSGMNPAPTAGSGGSPSPTAGTGGSAPPRPDARPSSSDTPRAADTGASAMPRFSFFVTSLAAMRKLSGSQDGFGGDLRYGEATGLAGADKICREIAELAMPGSGAKGWKAFLSTAAGGPNGGPVHARDRIGEGPWYDRLGRLVAASKPDLLQRRPRGADPTILNDLPNEDGTPNHQVGAPGCTGDACPDNHDTLTGTNEMGMLRVGAGSTCNDWTNKERTGRPWCGHSWPRGQGDANWMSSLAEGGCAPGVNLLHQGGPNAPTVGSGGGYGGIYCFAMTP